MEHWSRSTRLTLLTLLMRLTHHMPQVATKKYEPKISTDVDFDASIQTLNALQAAAYRLIGTATCRIEEVNGRFVCRLETQDRSLRGGIVDSDQLKTRFLDLVTDENLRARVAEKTTGIRNLILALAFGSLAADQNNK
jgi:His-Xaa-Ser system protein HxsD